VNLSPGAKVTLTITDIAFGGEGVGRLNDFVVFVPFVVVGETVEVEITEVKKSFARAKLLQVIQAAPERVQPRANTLAPAAVASINISITKLSSASNTSRLQICFQRIGGVRADLVSPVIPCPQPYGYRNRIMIRSQWNKPEQKLNIGFVRWDGGLVEDIEECKIAEPALNEEIRHVRAHPPPKGGIKVVLRITPDGWELPRDFFFSETIFSCYRNWSKP
jgi:23S rRNA (uracil1939-C5)-methyltransferase